MTDPGRTDAERRVLVLAPSGRDAALARDVFERSAVAAHVCSNLDEVCAELNAGAGALLIAEETTGTARTDCLTEWLARQPPWSDLPVLLLARPGADSPAVNRAVELLGNVTVLERPVRIAGLVSAARTALRGRDRQYQARQHLLDREQTATELRTLMDLLPVGVFIAHDPAGRRITGNRAANTLLRMPAASNLSRTAPPLERPTHFRPSRDGVPIPPDRLPVQRAARGEVVRTEEVDQVFDDGTIVRTLVSASPLFDAAGRPRGAVASITDITAQKRTEEALRASEARYRALFESIDEGFCVIEFLDGPHGPLSDYVHVEANAAYARHAGIPDVVGQKVRDMVPDEADGWVELYRNVLLTGEPVRFERDLVATGRHLELAAFRVETAGRRQVAVLFQDVTARKRAEAALRASEARQGLLVRLADALRPVSDPAAVAVAAGRVLGEHLGADRVAYFEIVGDEYVVEHDYAAGVPSLAGRYPVAAFGAGHLANFLAGRIVVEADATTQPGRPADERAAFAAIGVRGHVSVPLVKDGSFVAGMAVQCRDPREWTADEVALIEETAERTWAAVERAKAERALRASEARYRTLFESIDEGFCVIEVLSDAAGRPDDYRFLEVNPAFEAQAGMRGAVGRRMLEFAPAIEAHWLENYGRVADTGEPVRFAGEFKGLNRWFEVYAFRVGSPAARRVAVLFTDITARRRMEDDLRRSAADLAAAHEFLHSAIDALTSHIAVLDQDGTILAVNAAWRRFADENHYDGHDYGVGSNYLAECEPHTGDCVEGGVVAHGIREVLSGREPYFELEYPCHAPTEKRWFNMRVTRFKDGGPVRVVVAHEDVTQRRAAEEALKDADRRKNEFLAMLAHELRNPLAPIRNSLHILKLVGGGADAGGVHDMIERQVNHMVRLVDDLLEVSRITRGKIDLRRARVDLSGVLRTAVETSRPLIDAANHTLTVDVPADGLVVDGDAVRLAQVFANLLNNAAKYTDPGGAVTLRARAAGADAVVTVRDTGAGIPPEMLGRVFDLFTQLDRSDARAQGGLGIGLTLVKSLVELHGGRVAVRSDGPGKGSEFEVRLPLAGDDPTR